MRFFLLILAVLIGLIVGGSALVICNAFAISIGERKKQELTSLEFENLPSPVG